MLICHVCIFFGKMSVKVFDLFFNQVFFLIIEFYVYFG